MPADLAAFGGDERRDLDAVVIGAGFSGLYMVYKLRELGFSVRGYEKGSGVGGTWYWNRYPGARCDCESMYYSYSFLPELDQEWPLDERFPAQPKILAYLEHVAQRLDLEKEFTFDTEVMRATFDDATGRWTAWTSGGEVVHATYLITAVGCLSAANRPDIPGLESFSGQTVHTSAWPPEGVDFSGRRVGVIGTGASGIQAIPVIARQARQLVVFQRTAQFTVPAGNRALDPQFVAMWKANYPEWRRRGRGTPAGIPYTGNPRRAMDASPEERHQAYQTGWELGGPDFLLVGFGDLLVDEQSNAAVAEFVRDKIDEIVADPDVAELLKPRGFPLGSKRLPMDSGYYDTFNRENVSLVDLRRTPLKTVTPAGVQTTEAEHELDVLVFATGFDAMTGPLLAIDIQGRNGQSLSESWAAGPVTYLGLGMPGFPNLFTITGPGSPSVLVNMPVSIEQHVDWIADCLVTLRQRAQTQIEATHAAATTWTAHVQEVAHRTLFPQADSWYMGANVPGKPRLFMPYVGGMDVYQTTCDAVAAGGYDGFEISARPTPTEATDLVSDPR